jgi:hypothetical protein
MDGTGKTQPTGVTNSKLESLEGRIVMVAAVVVVVQTATSASHSQSQAKARKTSSS